ncbi:YqcI/YcgG family protein [Mycetocola saprophilus]|uniref:YqcI/YcgG family protein n=1 Tax=Mycetocola saprophilus TaxID=76636 RepID=UPI003BF1F770
MVHNNRPRRSPAHSGPAAMRSCTGTLHRASAIPAQLTETLAEFKLAVLAPGFPCFFAPTAFTDDTLLFGSIDASQPDFVCAPPVFDAAAEAINANPDQVIVLWVTHLSSSSLEEDATAARALLLALLRADPDGIPPGRPIAVADPHWDFWYRNIDFFINFSSAHHVLRNSRNLGSALTIVAQSRSSFDRLPEGGLRARSMIRERIHQFDDVAPSPSLGSHGLSPELPQFFLGDDNEPSPPLLTQSDYPEPSVLDPDTGDE